jgi:HAD superfamily hydrolase (TIGR01458 family)
MQAILFDLDGVIYVEDRLIEGAVETLRWCDENAISYVFVTNTTSKPPAAIAAKLRSFGIVADESKILSPPVAAVQWLQEQGLHRIAPYVTEQTLQSFSGFHLAQSAEEEVDAVVIGDLGESWSFEVLNSAFRQLMQQPRPALIALGMTRYWCASDGLRLDAGAFVSALQYASGIEPVVLGKPSPLFFRMALHCLGVDARDAVLIGDDIKTDIGGAQQAGLRALLVRTGKFTEADLNSPITPDGVLDSVADLPAWGKAR